MEHFQFTIFITFMALLVLDALTGGISLMAYFSYIIYLHDKLS